MKILSNYFLARQKEELEQRTMSERTELIFKSNKMKPFRTVTALILCMGFLFSVTSCAVYVTKDRARPVFLVPKDNGRHNGWYKNPNNPHNFYSTNQGKNKGKSKK